MATKRGSVIFIEDLAVNGKFSVIASVDRSKNPPVLSVNGVIETATRLPDKFSRLAGGRVVVLDVLIDSESAGSEDDVIVYAFTARSYEILERRQS